MYTKRVLLARTEGEFFAEGMQAQEKRSTHFVSSTCDLCPEKEKNRKDPGCKQHRDASKPFRLLVNKGAYADSTVEMVGGTNIFFLSM